MLSFPGIKSLGRFALEFGMAVGESIGFHPFAVQESGFLFANCDDRSG
jgi:hypothetical protein